MNLRKKGNLLFKRVSKTSKLNLNYYFVKFIDSIIKKKMFAEFFGDCSILLGIKTIKTMCNKNDCKIQWAQSLAMGVPSVLLT